MEMGPFQDGQVSMDRGTVHDAMHIGQDISTATGGWRRCSQGNEPRSYVLFGPANSSTEEGLIFTSII